MSLGLQGISHRFGDFKLGELSIEVGAGRYCVLLGPSGSGKSLLLKCAAGLIRPARGRVWMEGEDVSQVEPESRRVGYVFQDSSLFPHLNVRANVAYGLVAQKMKAEAREARLNELGPGLGIDKLWLRRPASLSGGEAQRVALARALAVRPRLLLLDEPMSQVDRAAREGLQEQLKRLHAELSLCVLHVTHDRDEARALGQDCVVMLGGQVIQSGPTNEVFEQPACAFVARFLGVGREGVTEVDCSEICLAGTGRCDRKEA